MATPEEAAAVRAAEQRTADAERKTAETKLKQRRLEVGKELGLDIALASRLVGSTREEMVADAKELGAVVETEREAEAENEATTMNDLIRAKAGRLPEPAQAPGPHDDLNAAIRAKAGR